MSPIHLDSISDLVADLVNPILRRPLMRDPIALAIADPGAVLPRGHTESLQHWAARAVRKVLLDAVTQPTTAADTRAAIAAEIDHLYETERHRLTEAGAGHTPEQNPMLGNWLGAIKWTAGQVRLGPVHERVITTEPIDPPEDLTPLVDECARRLFNRLPNRHPQATFDTLPPIAQLQLRNEVLALIQDVIELTNQNGAHQ